MGDESVRSAGHTRPDGLLQQLRIRLPHSGEERVLAPRFCRDGDTAAGHQRFGESAPGLAGTLVGVGVDEDAGRVAAPVRPDEAFLQQPGAVIGPHQLDVRAAVGRQLAGSGIPVRPGLRGVLIEPLGFPGWRADPVTADDHDILQPGPNGGRGPGGECGERDEEPLISHD